MIDALLKRIYDESPHDWPYGLSKSMFKSGSLWAVKHEGTSVGFVGWQETEDRGRRIGYYSVGVLPEHRNQGYAKAALRDMLSKQASRVDEVRAAISASNGPSLALSTSLAAMHKDAANGAALAREIGDEAAHTHPSAWMHAGGAALGALLGGPGLDNFVNGAGKNPVDNFNEGLADPARAHRMLWNSVLGAGVGVIGSHSPVTGATLGMLIPGKDLIIKATQRLDEIDPHKINAALDNAASTPPTQSWLKDIPAPLLYGALAGAAGATGIAGINAYQKYRASKAQEEAAGAGRVHITLPRKSDKDHETSLDLPISEINLTDALRARLGRDTKRTLYAETRERTRRRKPADPSAPTDAEADTTQLAEEEADINKSASLRRIKVLIKSGAAVPSPPQAGTNPAYAMQQQQQAVQQQPSQTQGNPEIQQAQQSAQQEIAQSQQQAQQELQQVQADAQQATAKMQQDMQAQQQQASTELEKAHTENEVLKLKAAEAEMKARMVDHHHKLLGGLRDARHEKESAGASETPDTGADMATTHKLIDARIATITKDLNKSAVYTAPTLPPGSPGVPQTPPLGTAPAPLPAGSPPPHTQAPKLGGLTDYNMHADAYSGQLWAPKKIYASMGNGLLDQLMNTARNSMFGHSSTYVPDLNDAAVRGADASDMMAQPGLARNFYHSFMSSVPQG